MSAIGRAPRFWWEPGPTAGSRILSPLGWVYGQVAARRLVRGSRVRVGAPVICVGNPTVGGGGKTPTALALGRAALALGRRPGFVSRGYGRDSRETLLVDPTRHGSAEVGDEPLLLARLGPTCVAGDRAIAAERLLSDGSVDLVIMDDGFQSQRLASDVAVLVVDGARGLGNGHVLPAGPLRAPLLPQWAHADRMIVVGGGEAGARAAATAQAEGLAIAHARYEALNGSSVAGRRVVAFAGIADPRKFYASLLEAGAEIVATRDFADHAPFSETAMARLVGEALRFDARLVTTAKDAARLARAGGGAARFLERCFVFEVALAFAEDGTGEAIVADAVARFDRRSDRL